MKWNASFLLLERLPILVREGDRDVLQPTKHGWTLRRTSGRMLSVLSGVIIPVTAWAQERPYDFWGMHPMWGMWGAWGFGMMLMMVVFWALIIIGLVLGLRWLVSQGRESRSDAALDILRQRYARGEIDREEFEAKKRDLR